MPDRRRTRRRRRSRHRRRRPCRRRSRRRRRCRRRWRPRPAATVRRRRRCRPSPVSAAARTGCRRRRRPTPPCAPTNSFGGTCEPHAASTAHDPTATTALHLGTRRGNGMLLAGQDSVRHVGGGEACAPGRGRRSSRRGAESRSAGVQLPARPGSSGSVEALLDRRAAPSAPPCRRDDEHLAGDRGPRRARRDTRRAAPRARPTAGRDPRRAGSPNTPAVIAVRARGQIALARTPEPGQAPRGRRR